MVPQRIPAAQDSTSVLNKDHQGFELNYVRCLGENHPMLLLIYETLDDSISEKSHTRLILKFMDTRSNSVQLLYQSQKAMINAAISDDDHLIAIGLIGFHGDMIQERKIVVSILYFY